jgi:diacylglycerol kinase family enzyme
MTKRIHVIINPASGPPRPVLHTINTAFRDADIEWDVSITKRAGDAHRFTAQLLAQEVDVIAVFGGDGSVMEAASAVIGAAGSGAAETGSKACPADRKACPLAILPGGTANVTAGQLGLPRDLEGACKLLAQESYPVQAVDVGLASSPQSGERAFLFRMASGLPAERVIAATRELKDRYGRLAYVASTLQQLKSLPVARYRLTLDGQQEEVEGVTCQVDNVAGMGLPESSHGPRPSFLDGLLDVTVITHLFIDSFLSAAAQSPRSASRVQAPHHWQVREATIEADPVQHVSVDGDVWGETPVSVRVLPQSVRFVVGGTPSEQPVGEH